MTDLVVELEKLSDTPLRERLIKEAKAGTFHDYRSKAVCGKMFFVECAQWFARNIHKVNPDYHDDIHKMTVMEADIKNGVYDEPCTEEDKAIMKKEIENDPTMSQKDKDFFYKAMKL